MGRNNVALGPVTPARIDTSAFGQAIVEVEALCKQLATAIAERAVERIAHIAREATSMWSTAFSACRRLVERSATSSPHADAARTLLEEAYMKLLELFEQAVRTIDVPRMKRTLGDLRITLVTAIAQPFSGGERHDTAGARTKGHHDRSI